MGREQPDDFDQGDELSLTLVAVSRLCGSGVADTLRRECGAEHLYIPEYPRPHQRIVQLVGIEAAERMADLWGGLTLTVPNGRHVDVRAIERLTRLGKRVSVIAREVGCSRRTVFAVRERLRRDGGVK